MESEAREAHYTSVSTLHRFEISCIKKVSGGFWVVKL